MATTSTVRLKRVRSFGVGLFYLALGVLGNWQAWRQGAADHLVGGTGGDLGQEIWFLKVVSHNFFNGLGFLQTDLINYPIGVNLTNMTAMPTLGVILAPITGIFGPIASYNVATTLAPALGALGMYWAADRWLATWTARFVAGLLFGFSPYVIAQNWCHLFLSTVVFFPLALGLLHEIFVRQKWSAMLSGMALGFVIVAQLGLSPEMLLDGCIALGIYGFVRFRRGLRFDRARWPYVQRALRFVAVPMLLPAALFVHAFLNGTNAFKGAYRPAHMVSHLATDIVNVFLPTNLHALTLGVGHHVGSLYYYASLNGPHVADPFEAGAYIGIPLLLALLLLIRTGPKTSRLTALLVTAAATMVISMGDSLRINGWNTHIPLPFAILRRLPLLDSSIASRWTLFLWLTVALIIGQGIDWAMAQVRSRPRSPLPTQRAATFLGLTAIGIVALAPHWPLAAGPQQVPTWFAKSASREIPRGATVVTYPIAQNGNPLPMMWQALNNLNYRLVAGAAGPQVTAVNPIRDAIRECDSGKNPAAKRAVVNAARSQIARYPSVYLVATSYGPAQRCASRLFTAIAGFNGTQRDDVLVWAHVTP